MDISPESAVEGIGHSVMVGTVPMEIDHIVEEADHIVEEADHTVRVVNHTVGVVDHITVVVTGPSVLKATVLTLEADSTT